MVYYSVDVFNSLEPYNNDNNNKRKKQKTPLSCLVWKKIQNAFSVVENVRALDILQILFFEWLITKNFPFYFHLIGQDFFFLL